MRWRIARAKPLDTWRSKEGKVLLLGDAAHAMLPNAGQGLSQGIEDGVALAEMLKYLNSDKSNLSELLERFEKFRRPRAIKFWEQSEELMKTHLLPEGPAQMERFEVYNKVGQGVKMLNASAIDWEEVQMDMEKPMHTLEFQKFLLKYDVIKEVSFPIDISSGCTELTFITVASVHGSELGNLYESRF
jgi:salicylate hydroxylase